MRGRQASPGALRKNHVSNAREWATFHSTSTLMLLNFFVATLFSRIHSADVGIGEIKIAHPLPELMVVFNELFEVTLRDSIVTSFLSFGSSA